MFTAVESHRVGYFISVLWNSEQAVVPGVFKFCAIASDEGTTAIGDAKICILDTQLRSNVHAGVAWLISIVVAVVGDARIIPQAWRERVRVANYVTAGMGEVLAPLAESRGKPGCWGSSDSLSEVELS